MSLSKSKRLCVGFDQKYRHSFDERICDDLCEVILQYLTLKDKLRLESVSKQFQRTIFQRQKHIWIKEEEEVDGMTEKHFYSKYKFNLNAFESVLKKCSNIKSVVINTSFSLSRRTLEKVVELIDIYCNNLIEFNSDLAFDEISWNKLIKNINSKTFTLRFDDNEYFTIDLKSLSFVKDLKITAKNEDFISINDIIGFNKIISVGIDVQGMTSDDLIELFNNISKLKHLIKLKFYYHISIDFNDNSITESLQQMAVNCIHLKSVSIDLKIKWETLSDIIPSFKIFKNLKQLNISFIKILKRQSFSFELFDGFEGLTHLTLEWDFMFEDLLSLKGIDVFLPKLKVLKINSICVNKNTVISLYRLKDLEEIDITLKYTDVRRIPSIYELFERNLIKNCKRIRKIQIESGPDLDQFVGLPNYLSGPLLI